MINESIIQKIKDENDIVEVISEKVNLKKAGNNYSGLCPFHNEKTPSFSVSREKQIFKCFGCGEAGNVFSFIMKYNNYTFVEAVKFLADRVNIDILPNDNRNKAKKKAIDKLYNTNVSAARFYFNNLYKNKNAMDYFTRRGISLSIMRKFGLGYAPEGWRNILNYLKSKGFSELDLLNVGLVVKGKNNSVYDRFRNRVIFPVFDSKGKVIGFGGRVLDDSKPKYLNSPETKLFYKGTNLYGLNFVLKNKREDRTVIIVEGYMDCISLHQFGIENVVASLGTALTEKQSKLLRRYFDRVIIAYDADIAGQNATMRGLEILRNEGFDLRVLTVPEGKDPDEFIRNNGTEAFKQLIKDSLPLVEYRIKKAGEEVDFKDNRNLVKYVSKISEIIHDLNPVEKDVYIKKVSEDTGVKEQAIYDLIKQENENDSKNIQNLYNDRDFGQKLYLEPAHLKAARSLIKFSIENKEMSEYIRERIIVEDFTIETHKRLFEIILKNVEKQENLKDYIDIKCTDVEIAKEWVNIKQTVLIQNDFDLKDIIDEFIMEIKKNKLEESKIIVMGKIKKLEKKGAYEETLELVKKLNEIQNELVNLNGLKGGK
ncbi:DNA primase [Clostridium sediminicola]|uniref:DNA primase n=1 Tax=Clostridium sediminicola TaxID=3114879 RepID=UPI0031F23AEB